MSVDSFGYSRHLEKYFRFFSFMLFFFLSISDTQNGSGDRRYSAILTFKLQCDKMYLLMCVKEDSNQPMHLCSLIGVFIVHMKTLYILGYQNCEYSDQAA